MALENYETVAERLQRWWEKYPDGSIITTMVHYDGQTVVFRAEGFGAGLDQRPIAVGFAEEVCGSSPVNKTSFVENCETSAVGRMIGNSPIGPSDPTKRPSREEMAKVQRATPSTPGGMAGGATEKQIAYIKGRIKGAGIIPPGWIDQLSKSDASQFIEAEKNGEAVQGIIDRMRGEEAF